MSSARAEVTVGGKRLQLSNLGKVLYPEAGFTKGQVIDYYVRAAPALLPHVRGRPLTMKRYPEGVEGVHFFEKRCPSHRPSWVRTMPVWSDRHDRKIDYCLANDMATLVWAANLADLELHTYLYTEADPARPTWMVFDLDPGAPAGLVECSEVALMLRRIFERLGLRAWPKTSGGKGLQVYVPLNTPVGFADTKGFARALAELLEERHPDLVTSKMKKTLRPGKVFIDWSQNDAYKSTVCVYSLRARARPTVSTPVTWTEVAGAARRGDADRLVFEAEDALARIDRRGDLFAPVLKVRQRLPTVSPGTHLATV